MNKAVIVVIALVILGAGGWLVASQLGNGETSPQPSGTESQETTAPAQEEEPAEEAEETAVVTYTDSGFSPQTIRVQRGTTVTWTNESSRAMWVASDVHPTHEELPAFDQLGSGQSYSFTFEQTGEWEYHDHLFASHLGTVIVSE